MAYHKFIVQIFGHCDLVAQPFSSSRFQDEISRQSLSRCGLEGPKLDTRVGRVTYYYHHLIHWLGSIGDRILTWDNGPMIENLQAESLTLRRCS